MIIAKIMEPSDSVRFTVEKLKLLILRNAPIRLSLLNPIKKGWSRVLSIHFIGPSIDLTTLLDFLNQIDEVYKIAFLDFSEIDSNR